jgi:hypothetical protein
MFDKMKFNIECKNIPKEIRDQVYTPVEWSGILFEPRINRITGNFDYEGFDRNLFLKFSYPNKLTFSNSIHKYYHGNNFNDFSYSNVHEGINQLAETYSFNLSDALITNIEYGCNNILINGKAIYEEFVGLKGKESQEMSTRSGFVYGRSCRLTDYGLKMYNKSYESLGILDDINIILRTELAVGNMKYLRNRKEPIPIYTLNDVLNKELWYRLSEDLLEKLRCSSYKMGYPAGNCHILIPDLSKNLIYSFDNYQKLVTL